MTRTIPLPNGQRLTANFVLPLDHFSLVENPKNQEARQGTLNQQGYGELELVRCKFCQTLRSMYRDSCPKCHETEGTPVRLPTRRIPRSAGA